MEKIDVVKKVCLTGDPGVGKTSLVRRFVLDQFDDAYISTIGAKVTKKVRLVKVPERGVEVNLVLMIWDVAGQKEYHMFHEMYMKGMEGVLSVADLTRKTTYDGLRASIRMAEHAAGEVPIVLLLNKADLADPSASDLKEIRSMASEKGLPVLATSAKTGMNVEKAFEILSERMVRRYLERKAR
jgi:small GTP-binding protein